jgi:two-component system phosphate regulon response regulator PhoB
VRELMLRIRALLRRSTSTAPREDVALLAGGPLRIDLTGHRVWVNGEEIALTSLEFKLLTTLFSRRGRVQSRERLLEDIWNTQSDLTSRTIDTHVKRLRQKLGRAGDLIETLRGVGYRFADVAADV